MAKLDDPYATLGVPRTATQDEIRKAYRKLARQHHPDLNPGDAVAEAAFKKASAANELLSDAEKRGKFDRGEIDASGQEKATGPSYRDYAQQGAGQRYSRAGAQSGGWNPEDLNDVFGSMFGQGQRRRNMPQRGSDENYTLTCDFLDAINGATPRLTLPDGRSLSVKIPAGTKDGQILRLRGQGAEGLGGGAAGDALITVTIKPHAYFERRGNDIHVTLPVTITEAALGGPVQVPTPQGPVKMKIPAGSDSGTELRLRGRGVPAHGKQDAGNLYAKLSVVIGAPDDALKAFLAEWTPKDPVNPRAAMEDKA
ncbi:DnaJ C-terminal domain-containing protein [Loktanella salsilacus]|uniref:DnaJ C-terminal domain-containing protein n=1 Tax=Loktanella salsilacus TaxID=195913 RepID=UPI0020B73066|nr:J domain-containing protein [Loktanella salsilacus]